MTSLWEKQQRISQLERNLRTKKRVNKQLTEQLVKSEARIKDFPIMEIMASRNMTYREEGEKIIFSTGDKTVFVKADDKLFTSKQKEVKTAIQAYLEINVAQSHPNYKEKTIDSLKVFSDFAAEFGQERALAAFLFHDQNNYQMEIAKMREMAARKQEQQMLAKRDIQDEKSLGHASDGRGMNDHERHQGGQFEKTAAEQQRCQEQTQAALQSSRRGEDEKKREQEKQQMHGRTR